jgi:hypothetical protein
MCRLIFRQMKKTAGNPDARQGRQRSMAGKWLERLLWFNGSSG